MKRFEAGNMLMIAASLIVALHTGLFGVWVSAAGNSLRNTAQGISLFGIIFISLNIIFWIMARMKFQKEIINTKGEQPFNNMMSAGLVFPFILILIGWIFCCLCYDFMVMK